MGVNTKIWSLVLPGRRLQYFVMRIPMEPRYVKQYVLDKLNFPGSEPCIVVRRQKNDMVGWIVVSKEQVFTCIDKWHRGNGHMGQERTWGYCIKKYNNVSQGLVRHYCDRNSVTQTEKGSRKPIQSKWYKDRFQINLIDSCMLRKRDPFVILMHWVMPVMDHAIGLSTCVLFQGSKLNLLHSGCKKSLASYATPRSFILTMEKSSHQQLVYNFFAN